MRTLGLIILLALVAGLPNLPRSMHGDQVFTLLGAESLARGELLYRDFWDIRQPGLIVGYWLAGTLFGFDEVGLHLFDLLFWLAFAIFIVFSPLSVSGRGAVGEGLGHGTEDPSPLPPARGGEWEPKLSIWPALATSGWYWAVTGGVPQMQPEAMVGPILYVHLWLLLRRSRTSWAIAGLFATIVLLLKLMFLPLLGIALLFAIMRMRREQNWGGVLQRTGIYILTCTLALAASLVPWAVAGELDMVQRTFFEHPTQMLAEVPRPSIDRLFDAAKWFGTRYGPLLALAAIGSARLWRDGKREWMLFLLAWCFTALIVIVAQRFSWWSYHFMLLAIPVGLLAAEGGSECAKKGRPLGRVLLLVVFLPVVAAIALKWQPVVRHGFCLSGSDREALLLREDSYRLARKETAFLREATSRPGPIFVAGEPIFYRYAGRTQATSIHGWSLELYSAEIRVLLAKQLVHAEPAYIFIDRVYYAKLIEKRYPELIELLRLQYRIIHESAVGTWYERLFLPLPS